MPAPTAAKPIYAIVWRIEWIMEILDYIIFFIFAGLFVLPLFLPLILQICSRGLPRFLLLLTRWGMIAETADHWEYVCPHCGNSFQAKWYQMLFGRAETSTSMGWARLKCPFCKVTDACKRVKID